MANLKKQWQALQSAPINKFDKDFFKLMSKLVFAVAAHCAAKGRFTSSVDVGIAAHFFVHDSANQQETVEYMELTTACHVENALSVLENYYD